MWISFEISELFLSESFRDILSLESLWTLYIQVSKKTTTKKQNAGPSNKANKKEKNEGNKFLYIP